MTLCPGVSDPESTRRTSADSRWRTVLAPDLLDLPFGATELTMVKTTDASFHEAVQTAPLSGSQRRPGILLVVSEPSRV
jgi:hypothetical protein